MSERSGPPRGCDLVLQDANVDDLSIQSVADQVEILSTVGNETRYRILLFLTATEDAVCGCELEPHFDVGQSSISQSLTRLHKVGLLDREKEGRWRYYEATETAERLVELVEDEVRDELTI